MTVIADVKDTKYQEGKILPFKVEEATKIIEGALVAINAAGYAVNATDTASEVVVGICDETVDNTSGADGDEYVKVRTHGVHEFVARFSAAQTNVGDLAYAFDNQTVDLAANLTNDILVGRIVEVVSASKVRVDLNKRV